MGDTTATPARQPQPESRPGGPVSPLAVSPVAASLTLGVAAPPEPSPARLDAVLAQHRAWVGSGWELGRRADLQGADLHQVDLDEAVLSGADLHACDLHGASLDRADLDGADLHAANLDGAHLRAAYLPWADLHDADLHAADLRGADLRDADLHGADLSDADLGEADLRGADLRHARGLQPRQLAAARTDASTLLEDTASPSRA